MIQSAINPRSKYYFDRTNNQEIMIQTKTAKQLRNPDSYLDIAKRRKNLSKSQPKYEYNFLTNTRSLSMSPQILLNFRKSQLREQINQGRLSCKCNCHNCCCCNFNCCCNFIDKNSTSLRSQSMLLNRKIKKNTTISKKSNNNSEKNVKNKFIKSPKSFDKKRKNVKKIGKNKKIDSLNNNTLKSKKPFKKTTCKSNKKENEANSKNLQKFFSNFKNTNTLYNDRYDYNNVKSNNFYNTQSNNNMKIYESNNFNNLTNSYNYNDPKFSKNKLFFHRTQPISGINTKNCSNRYFSVNSSNSLGKSANEEGKNCEYFNQLYKFKTINYLKSYINNANNIKNGVSDSYEVMFEECERKIKKLLGKFPNQKNREIMLRSMYSNNNYSRPNRTRDLNFFRKSELLKSNRF